LIVNCCYKYIPQAQNEEFERSRKKGEEAENMPTYFYCSGINHPLKFASSGYLDPK
jgi:hypothetical protein